MGNGIAHVMALADYEVILTDVSKEHLNSATAKMAQNLERQILANKIYKSQSAQALEKLTTTIDLKVVSTTDLITESVDEKEEMKRKIFHSVMPYLKDHTLLTSNTSSISITHLANSNDRLEKFL